MLLDGSCAAKTPRIGNTRNMAVVSIFEGDDNPHQQKIFVALVNARINKLGKRGELGECRIGKPVHSDQKKFRRYETTLDSAKMSDKCRASLEECILPLKSFKFFFNYAETLKANKQKKTDDETKIAMSAYRILQQSDAPPTLADAQRAAMAARSTSWKMSTQPKRKRDDDDDE
jgi:hypothetical protein